MIYLAGDKHGYKAIQCVAAYLHELHIPFVNVGVKHENEDMRLEDFIPLVTKLVLENKENSGILSCGTGVGVEVGANKFAGIRACLATNEEIAKWAKIYDKTNMLCLSGWQTSAEMIRKIVGSWIQAEYDGNEKRLHMLTKFDEWH